MAVAADNLTLVVADSYRHQLIGFDIAADGSLSGRRVARPLREMAAGHHHLTGVTKTVCDHACEVLGRSCWVGQDSAASMILSSPSLTALTTAS